MAKVRYTVQEVVELADGIIAEAGGKMTYADLYVRVSTENPTALPLLGKALAARQIPKKLKSQGDGTSVLWVYSADYVAPEAPEA